MRVKTIKTLFHVDDKGCAILDDDSRELIGIAEEVMQLLQLHNLCIGEAHSVLGYVQGVISRRGEETLL